MANKPNLFAASSSNRRVFLLGASALGLSACSGMIGPPDAGPMYMLKPALPPAQPQGAPVTWAMTIEYPTTSDALDTNRIALTHSDTTLDYYANATWPDSLPRMVQTAMLSAFQDSGRLPAVSREQDALHADYNLNLDIRDFAAHYADADGAPKVTVSIIAQMVTAHGRKVVANLAASQSEQASANSVEAVVQAMNAALGPVIGQITAWALALPPPAAAAAP
jgi:cholesterol transport system auxiliary component